MTLSNSLAHHHVLQIEQTFVLITPNHVLDYLKVDNKHLVKTHDTYSEPAQHHYQGYAEV